MTELSASDPILKRVADEVMEKSFFIPAVEDMKRDFESNRVTQEIAGGLDSPNISGTLDAPFREDTEGGDTIANLWGFIGFDVSPEEALAPIRERLNPDHPDGPKMIYRGRDKEKLNYRYEIRAPSEEAIYSNTGFPWAEGISWVKRIEQGVPGVGQFLNVANRPSSRSGGGIQIKASLRSGRYKPVKYFSQILNNFLRRVSGRGASDRRGFSD
jgi:hypothetical protein